ARPLLREAFRGTSCHATVSVDDMDSSVAGGPFLWAQHARAQLLMVDLARGIVVAEHDGYERLQDPVTHRRAVVALEDGSVLVVDVLLAAGRHRYSQRWPLHPSLELEACSAERVVAVAEETGVGLVLRFPPGESTLVASARGVAEPPIGWWSERLESVSPSWLVSVDAEVSGPFEIVTLVTPFEKKMPGDVQLEASATSAGTRIELGGPRRRRTIEVDLRSTPVRVES
ncbi:MAG: heparinase II/III-family protein, partial [Actinobacteria bacterium]|nr:heparinase II/III-family protein [Actinomycetota bacterium]